MSQIHPLKLPKKAERKKEEKKGKCKVQLFNILVSKTSKQKLLAKARTNRRKKGIGLHGLEWKKGEYERRVVNMQQLIDSAVPGAAA